MRSFTAEMLVIVVLFTHCFAQKQAQHATQSLAKPVDWGTSSSRLFSDSKQVKFLLTTSWIPGENHKGAMRYKMAAWPDDAKVGDDPTPLDETHETTERLMGRVHNCIIELNLFDENVFLLRKTVVPFGFGVNDQGRVISLQANSAIQMDAHEYREFIGSPSGGGSWNISWDCGTP
jgi:hypothetical protein